MQSTQTLEQALDDILAMKRSISGYKKAQENSIETSVFHANRLAQIIALIFTTVLIGLEVFGGSLITQSYVGLNSDPYFRLLGVSVIGGFVFFCLGLFYFIIWRTAQRNEHDLNQYIQRHFKYLQNIAHASDLLIKVIVVAALIWAQHPQWIAPFLYLFIADYLIQGRFFTLRHRTSLALAAICFAAAVAHYYLDNAQLVWPLVMFGFCVSVSLIHLHHLKQLSEE